MTREEMRGGTDWGGGGHQTSQVLRAAAEPQRWLVRCLWHPPVVGSYVVGLLHECGAARARKRSAAVSRTQRVAQDATAQASDDGGRPRPRRREPDARYMDTKRTQEERVAALRCIRTLEDLAKREGGTGRHRPAFQSPRMTRRAGERRHRRRRGRSRGSSNRPH